MYLSTVGNMDNLWFLIAKLI